jgi:putative spermidine/putrescine transport system permease protein
MENSMRRLLQISVLLLVALPAIVLLWLSLAKDISYPSFFGSSFTFDFWRNVFTGGEGLLKSLGWSMGIAFFVALVSTFFGFIISRKMSSSALGQRSLQLAYLPYLIAPVVLGAMLQFYFTRWGWTGSTMGVIMAQLLFIMPYAVLVFSGFWTPHIKQLAFQATTLGASNNYVLRHIVLPVARSWFFLTFSQCFLISWFEYGITQLIGVGKVQTLTIKSMVYVKESSPQYGAVAACMMIVPVLLLFVINSRVFLKKEVEA